MRVWLDLSNSPHVPLLSPVVDRLRADGHEVLLTVRDHAQTLALAQREWPTFHVIGGSSPSGRMAKGAAIARRAEALRRFARRHEPVVAFSHGSYAQLLAARAARLPSVTMMDYEHQPANHVSFRLADRVIVPAVFPARALGRQGAAPSRIVRYPGFKEELYLGDFRPDPGVLRGLGVDPQQVIVVLRPPPDGALYHRMTNDRFAEILRLAADRADVQAILLPRTQEQALRYGTGRGVLVPERPPDGSSLLALADLVVGAGGTMTREAAVLGTPTYTVFAGSLGAVDLELLRSGHMQDLRDPAVKPSFVKKQPRTVHGRGQPTAILQVIVETIEKVGSGAVRA
jgi:predicted glycosyltransferase